MTQLFLKAALVGDTWVLYLLLAASIYSVSVIVGRVRVFRANRVDVPTLLESLQAALDKGDMKAAMQAAQNAGGVEGRVAEAGLNALHQGAESAEELMGARLIRERQVLEKDLIVLGTLGNNAPFVGLFGTVLGIIKAFNDLAMSGSGGAAVVMAGISTALVATAFGILVAIPAVIANNYFLSKLRMTLANADAVTRVVAAHAKHSSKRAR